MDSRGSDPDPVRVGGELYASYPCFDAANFSSISTWQELAMFVAQTMVLMVAYGVYKLQRKKIKVSNKDDSILEESDM